MTDTSAAAAPTAQPGRRVVVMGVSGCGKTTIGTLVAEELGLPFTDGDSLHPASNVAKMAAGHPLNDADRAPWLEAVGKALASSTRGLVVACSALKRSYRDTIRAHAPDVVFLHLDGRREVLEARLRARSGHFMPVALLDSQLSTLEQPEADEHAVVIDISPSVKEVVGAAVAGLQHAGQGPTG